MSLEIAINKYKEEVLPSLSNKRKKFEAMDLKSAVKLASFGKIEENGKMDSHQRHIGYKICEVGAFQLLSLEDKFQDCKCFKDIMIQTDIIKNQILSLGDLWSYDSALRIGFNLKLYPLEVYVQSGVKDGVRKFFGGSIPKNIKGRTIQKQSFGEAFMELEPYEIENFLCVWGKKSV